MGAHAVLSTNTIFVAPGDETYCDLTVRNTGSVVDEFTLEVYSDGLIPWVELDPPVLPLFPDAEGTVRIYFRPPLDASLPSGPMPFAVRVASREDPDGSVVEEGTIEVGSFVQVGGELAPRIRHARLSAAFRVALDNFGNAPVSATLHPDDPAEILRFSYPPAMTASSGTRTVSKLRVRPKRQVWWGQPQLRPFSVTLDPEGAAAQSLDGQLVQVPIIPKLLIWLLLALIGLVILWAVLLQPTIESAAKEGAAEEAQKARAAAADAAQSAETAEAAAEESEEESEESATEDGDGADAGPDSSTVPVDERLVVEEAEPGEGGELGPEREETFTVPDGTTLSVTDLVLQNPSGDSGILTIARESPVDGETTRSSLLVVALENFRDLDYHFVSPLIFSEGESLVLSVACREGGATVASQAEEPGDPDRPAAPPEPCTRQAVYFTGVFENQKQRGDQRS